MNFFQLLSIEFMKIKRSKIIPLIFIAPILIISSGIGSLSTYMTPGMNNSWMAMFIQSALLYSYYLLPLTMIVVCIMMSSRETKNNGITKMLCLPIKKEQLLLAKFAVIISFLFLQIIIFLFIFIIAGTVASRLMNISETIPLSYLIKCCFSLFVLSIPCTSFIWMITVISKKPIIASGLNILLVIPGVLASNTPLWVLYPYCYGGSMVSYLLHNFSSPSTYMRFPLFPFVLCALFMVIISLLVSTKSFNKNGLLHM